MSEIWTVTHPATGVTLGTETTLRAARTTAEDAYKQHTQFGGDVECYAYTLVRDRATGSLRMFAHDGEQTWSTGVEITKTSEARVQRCCQQCSRVGTRGFRLFPDGDVVHDGKVVVSARSMTECANGIACKRRQGRISPATWEVED